MVPRISNVCFPPLQPAYRYVILKPLRLLRFRRPRRMMTMINGALSMNEINTWSKQPRDENDSRSMYTTIDDRLRLPQRFWRKKQPWLAVNCLQPHQRWHHIHWHYLSTWTQWTLYARPLSKTHRNCCNLLYALCERSCDDIFSLPFLFVSFLHCSFPSPRRSLLRIRIMFSVVQMLVELYFLAAFLYRLLYRCQWYDSKCTMIRYYPQLNVVVVQFQIGGLGLDWRTNSKSVPWYILG